jgi:hypothetical protein
MRKMYCAPPTGFEKLTFNRSKGHIRGLWILLLFMLPAFAFGQASSANYVFTTATNGSLTDMSSGTTQLVAALQDDASSPVTNIGFEVWFMGARYTQFSVNSNGYLRLGGTGVATTQYTLGTASVPLIATFGSDEITSSTGKVHYKVSGASPNRILVVEFSNMTVIYDGAGATTDATSQVRFYEGTGAIELVYGSINRNLSTGFQAGMEPQYIGFSFSSTAGNFATVTSSTMALATTGTPTSNQYTLGSSVTELTSAVDGSRKILMFTPATNTAPTGLNFTSVNAVAMTLNWTDNSTDETGFAIYRSDDGGITYNFQSLTAANAVSYVAGGLTPSTNYFWKVYAVREIPGAALSGSQSTPTFGNVTSNGTGGGLWSAPATWTGGVVPTAGDNVTIKNGDNVTIDVAAAALSVTVGQGTSGTLQFEATTARTLTVGTDVTVTQGASFTSNSAGTINTHLLSLGGNLTNNGVLDFSTNTNTAGAGISFTGAANNTFGGTGATTDVRTITLNKGTSNSNILELNPSNFTVQGTSVDGTPMAFLTLTNGTLKVSGTFPLTGRVFTAAGYTIGATAGFWLNNPNVTVAAQNGSATEAGLLRISQGVYNIGTATGNSMGFSAGSTVTVEGGTINAAGRFGVAAAANAINYTQSGGVITVCMVGNTSTTLGSFDLGTSTSSTVSLTGGTIVCQLAATSIDYRYQSAAGAVSGGTLQLGNGSSGTAKSFNLRGILPNVVVTSTSANHTATMSTTITNYNNLSLNITTQPGATFNCGNAVFLFNGNTIVNDGILTHTGTSSRFITFSANTNISYSGAGTVTAPMTSLELQNDLNFTISPASQNIATTRIIIFTGSFVNANKLTLGNGGATTAVLQIGNTTTPTNAGTFDVAPAFNLGTGGQTISYLRVVNPRSTGPEVNPGRILTNMTVDDNAHDLTLTGGNLSVTGTLALTTGKLIVGNNNLTVGALSGGSALSYVKTNGTGTFKRSVGTTATAFPVGNTAYNPISLTNTGTLDNYSVRVIDDVLSGGTSGTSIASNTVTPVVGRTWDVSEEVAGGSVVTMVPQWNAGETTTGFDNSLVFCSALQRYCVGKFPEP